MWILFVCKDRVRYAIRPFVGGVNAISGQPLAGDMTSLLKSLNTAAGQKSQDYLVIPKQHWLDGIATSPGTVKQFVATPMLSPAQQAMRSAQKQERELRKLVHPNSNEPEPEYGASIELQLTGFDRTGGLQLAIIPEYDLDRMSFCRSRNTYYKTRRRYALHLSNGVASENLYALSTPKELGFVNGDNIYMKNLDQIAPSRQKSLGDLWNESLDNCRTSGCPIVQIPVTSFLAQLRITCQDQQSIAALDVEV